MDLAQFTLEVAVTGSSNNTDEDHDSSCTPSDLPVDLKLDDEVRLDKIKFAEESRNDAAANLRPFEQAWLPDVYSLIFRLYVFGPLGFWTMAPLRYTAKFDPFLSLDCAPTPSTLAQSKERKGSNFAIWQPCHNRTSGATCATSTSSATRTSRTASSSGAQTPRARTSTTRSGRWDSTRWAGSSGMG